MVHMTSAVAVGLLGLTSIISAHPGHNHATEAAERAAFVKSSSLQSRSLANCASTLKARGLESKNVARRQAAVKHLRRRRGINTHSHFNKARSLNSVVNTDHQSNLTNVDMSTDPSILFGSEATCILAPDVTQGPYYVTGEQIRENIVESQEGVPLYMDIQVIDTNTCNPLPKVYMDLWHCNATGVYSGIQASGNGNSADATNLDATFLRGIQPSNDQGIVQFTSIFPGHYTSRATHIHVLTHTNVTHVQPNNTLSDHYTAHSSHVGQLFFDQDLISAVEATSPYSTNTQEVTTNANDSILSEEADTIDPVMEYVYLGEDVSDGIFAWVTIGVDSSAESDITPAAIYSEDGGVEVESSGSGGGGGSPPRSSSSTSSTAGSKSTA